MLINLKRDVLDALADWLNGRVGKGFLGKKMGVLLSRKTFFR